MSTRPDMEEPLAPGDGARDDASPSLAARWRSICGVGRQIFGIPDYERYLAHAAANHPGQAVLSREEFCREAIDRRYGGGKGGRGGGMRCC